MNDSDHSDSSESSASSFASTSSASSSPPPPARGKRRPTPWFSITPPAHPEREYDLVPVHARRARAPPRSPSPPSSDSSWSSWEPPRRRRRQWPSAQWPAGRRTPQLVLALLVPVLGLLLALELRSQHALRRAWAAEHTARVAANAPDARGRVDLAALRGAALRQKREGALAALEAYDVLDEQEEASLAASAADAWPAWWGSVDDVGPSPFDHVPAAGGPRRVLFLTSYDDYLERMNTHTYEIVDAAIRHPNVIVDVWGPGWSGYDWNVTLSVNVKRRANRVADIELHKEVHEKNADAAAQEYRREQWATNRKEWARKFLDVTRPPDPSDYQVPFQAPTWKHFDDECNSVVKYDIVWTFSDIYKASDMAHVDALDCGALLVQQLGDCHEHRCMKEWYPQANNITLTKYAFELEEIFNYDNVRKHYPNFTMGLFGHSPDTGNEWDFYPTAWAAKRNKAMIFGYDGSFYPIRTTITDNLNRLRDDPHRSDSEALVGRHQHPGYTVGIPESARTTPLETYQLGHETYKTHRALRADFGRGMREAQICVFDSSLERKMIRKYAQAMLSGCVLATDLPTEHEEALSKFTIPLEPSWSIDQIERQLQKFLDDPARLHQMALDAFAYARKHLTTTSKVSSVLALADSYRAGARGYDHAFGFSSRCRAYWSGDDAQRPPWCKAEHGYRGLEDRVSKETGGDRED
ncbi:hypothetical protein Q8F55_001461 [Vanrija albida]|uniref:Glycosyl transferase CAP10 domain-containing protein n=1 Tax=Vanrija albida TaxID=181172 RepID=A0ABR3QG98_9TREE